MSITVQYTEMNRLQVNRTGLVEVYVGAALVLNSSYTLAVYLNHRYRKFYS